MTGHLRNGQNIRVVVIADKTVAEVAKIFVISLCFYAFDITFSLFIYQIGNTNYCITLLKGGLSLGAQKDRTTLYYFRVIGIDLQGRDIFYMTRLESRCQKFF